jgi:hypothetical protein
MAIEWVGLFIYCAKAVLNSNDQCLDEVPVSDGTGDRVAQRKQWIA